MFGGSGKLGRGGGGSAGKRSIHAPPTSRPSPSSAPAGRLSMSSGPRGRVSASYAAISGPSTSSLQVEESFSLVRENPLNFAMAIKLVPDLVEEIKRVEAQGGTARIKFDANPNNNNGNVINVGDKNFKFTWSREIPDLCDIYEERQSGEDGNGLLVESGAAWRKLNVQRVLDESTKNHVKMRSEEAERKLKSRKAIILDPQNPSMKNQMKALAAAESIPWKNFKHRKEPPYKKPKSDPTPVGGPPKSVYKSGLSTTTPSKSKLSSGSPLSSQLHQFGTPASPVGSGNLLKGHGSVPDVSPAHNMNKSAISDKEIQSRLPNNTSSEKSKQKHITQVKPSDLKSLMISLLMEHHSKGMSLKALERAIGDVMPNSAREIEPILKQIATFQAPGRYFLRSGVEIESFKKQSSKSGSSPQISSHQIPEPQNFDQISAQDPSFSMRTSATDEEQAQLNSTPAHASDAIEEVDILHNTPDRLSDKKVPDNSEGLAGSSSDSGSDSDSDSDSSDSGSDSGSQSRSKSKSPVGSQSGSSSDSESDASSSSKQASDEDVDIMTSDDDKESKHKLQDTDPVSSKSPVQLRPPDSEYVDIGNCEKQDDRVSDLVEIEKDSPEDNHEVEKAAINYVFLNQEGEEPVEEIKNNYPANYHDHQQRQNDINLYSGPVSGVSDGIKSGQSGSHGKLLEGKSKRRSDDKHSDERPHNHKRLKGKNLSQPVSGAIKLLFGDSPDNSIPDKPQQMLQKGPVDQNKAARNGIDDPSIKTGIDQGIPTRYAYDSQQPGERSVETSGWAEAPSGEKRPGEHHNVGPGVKYSERTSQINEDLWIKKGYDTEIQTHNEDGLVSERRPTKLSAEGLGEEHASLMESHNRKPEMLGKRKEAGPHSNSYTGYSPKHNSTSVSVRDRSPVMNGRGIFLQREHSDLELGELREPLLDKHARRKKQFEQKSSLKQLENRLSDSECWNSDSSRGKSPNNIRGDSRKLSPPISEAGVSGIPDRPFKRKVTRHYGDDLTRPLNRATQPLLQQHQSSGDHTEHATQHNKVSDRSSKGKKAGTGGSQGVSLEGCGDTSRIVPVNATAPHNDPVREVTHSTKESKKVKPTKVGDSNRRKDSSLRGSDDGGKIKRESSSDENSCPYTKYEKEEPELKGPINDVSQYEEYLNEYREKYESYFSLSKDLESYRNQFSNLGKDLEAYRGRDMKKYDDILGKLRSSFRQCGERCVRLKKIFVVLHEELQNLKQMMKDYAAKG
ncbi:hypothetical protein ACJIZ3_025419 [Penstemon smallii]|uniref:OCEL domain-containing protein n=1 Tax=Penstemon smallii TaxID=265156 RepID=A0ABD3TXW1_9LAMI